EIGSGNMEIFVNRGVQPPGALLVRAFTGQAVHHPGHNDPVRWIRKPAGTLRTAVPESFGRGVQAISVGHRTGTVPIRIDDDPETKVEGVVKGVVVKAGAMPGGEG